MEFVVLFRIAENYTERDIKVLKFAKFLCKVTNGQYDVIWMASMIPESCKKIPYIYGARNVYHISDRIMAGSDTYATSYILAKAIDEYVPNADLIITTVISKFGETGQIPAAVAAWLDRPFAVNVTEIELLEDSILLCKSSNLECIENVQLRLPGLISVGDIHIDTSDLNYTLQDIVNAYSKDIIPITHEDIYVPAKRCGLNGSHTAVIKSSLICSYRSNININGTKEEKASRFLQILRENMQNSN